PGLEGVRGGLAAVSSRPPGLARGRRPSGAATVAAMVEGSAPGGLADTWMVGNSMLGSAATGMKRYATAPARNNPTDSRMVAIGRAMNGNEKFRTFLRSLPSRMPFLPGHAASVPRL